MASIRSGGLPSLRDEHDHTHTTPGRDGAQPGGIPADPADVLTGPTATASFLRAHHPGARCFLLHTGDLGEDLDGIGLVESERASFRRACSTPLTTTRRGHRLGRRSSRRAGWSEGPAGLRRHGVIPCRCQVVMASLTELVVELIVSATSPTRRRPDQKIDGRPPVSSETKISPPSKPAFFRK